MTDAAVPLIEPLSASAIAAVLRAGEDRPRKQKLQLRRERARAVPATAAVKEPLSVRAQRREHMLEVRCRNRKRTEGGRIKRGRAGRREGRPTRSRS